MKKVTVAELAFKKLRWNDLFENEDMLLQVLRLHQWDRPYKGLYTVVGYEYLTSFKSYLEKHGQLTEKQMTQLKRLAKSVYYYHAKKFFNNFGDVGSLMARL